MKSLREQIADKCVHFNGIGARGKTCDAAVDYDNVRDRSRGLLLAALPCFREGEAVACDKRRWPTDAEVDVQVAEIEAALASFKERVSRGECASCGAKVKRYSQVGHCAYAEPCGHRYGQADADALNELLDTTEGSELP